MIRKLAIAAAAIAALGTASLVATTPATAGGWKGGFHHHHFYGGGYRFYAGPTYVYGSCYRRYWGVNAFGEPVLRRVYVCG